MVNYWWCACLFRILLPCLLAVASARPTISSYIYLLMGFYLPFFSVPTYVTMVGSTGTYIKLLVIVCILICSCVTSFYFALFFPTGEDYDMEPCGTFERYLRTVGIVEFQNLPIKHTLAWCLPEPLMLLTSVMLYVALKKLTEYTEVIRETDETEESDMAREVIRRKLVAMFLNSGKYFVVFLFCLAAVLRPSLFGVIYYFTFMIVLTYWACNKPLGKLYARILVGLSPIIGFHVSMLFFYQMQYFQDNKNISPETLYGRLFQLVRLNTYKDCEDPRIFKLHEHPAPTYALPYVLYLLYYIAVLVSREILQAKDGVLALFIAFFKREPRPDFHAKWKMAFRKVRQQIEDEKLLTVDENLLADRIKRLVEQALQFVIRIAYLVANFIMMIWAITYIGWKSLLLLMWANLIWLLPGRRKIMLTTSPFLVVYIWFLLITSYIYSMDLDLQQKFGMFNLASGAHFAEELMWSHLLIKSLFSVIIFITMRQLFQERALKREQRNLAEAMEVNATEAVTDLGLKQPQSKTWQKIANIVKKWSALCWIWVVVITMIWMDFMSTSNPFRIAFVFLAIILVSTFQIFPFHCWKRFLLVYWWIVITYAMFNLFVLYMYQIEMTRKLLHKYTYNEKEFARFGFIAFKDTKERFIVLANPLFFQIAIVIQQNYLQKNFDRFTAPESSEELDNQERELEEIDPFWKKIVSTFTKGKNFVFFLLELHLQKIILLFGWLLCCFDWCALFLPFVLLLTASCIFGRLFTWFTIHLMSFFVQILILLRLIYMNQYMNHHSWDYVGHYERNGKAYNVTLNTADWLGFHKSEDGRDYADFWQLAWCFLFVFTVTLDPVVHIRQLNYKKSRNMSTARQRVLFPDINDRNCHENTKNMLKFLVNYGFYKFGVEFTAVVAILVTAIRMDLIAIAMALGLLTTFSLNRKWTERVLMPYMILVGVWLPFQYTMSLGFWPTHWNHTKTRFWNANDLQVRIQQFCHILNMAHPPEKRKFLYDFVLLMCFSRQWRMFRVIRQLRGEEFGAGSNDNVGHLIDLEGVENPVPDFVTYSRSFLDIYKKLFFLSWFYLALLVTFLAGTVRPAIYSFGYILASFCLMWEGTDMFLRPPNSILFRWNLLILYNLTILAFRTISQIFGCILVYEWQDINCKIYSMFNVVCVDRFGTTDNIPNMDRKLLCKVHFDPVGLQWDCVCFCFLIIQQRIFKSFHFFHIINDAKAQTILANRGAKLIEEQRQKKRLAFDNQDALIRTNIKKKVQRYEENRQKIQVLRSGDYYLFDEVEQSLDIPLLPPKQEYVDSEYDPYDPMRFYEYLSLFLKSGLASVLEARALRRIQQQAVIKGKKGDEFKKAVALKLKPGTSKDPDPIDTSEVKKVMNIYLFLLGLIESVVVSLTALFNRMTKEFRFILNEMDKERTFLKEKTNYTQGVRVGFNKIWKPSQTYGEFVESQKGKQAKETQIHYSIYEKLLRSIWYLGLMQSEWLCYLVIILNQVIRTNFISLPLPIMVFCWGALTVPKPTKTFWVINIAYALIMSIIKNFFVMEIADWNEHTFPDNSFYPPSVIGIDRYINSWINLSLLCALFFHRVILQSLGLWEPFVYRTASLIQDGNYNVKEGKLVPVNKNEAANKNTMNVKSAGLSMGDYFPRSVRHGARKYAEGLRLFIQQLISPSSTQIPVDVYTPMFLCDLLNLLLIVFYYSYFETKDTEEMGFIQFVRDNRVPVTYICVIVGYFVMIVIDRWIYMRKNRFAKLVYHFFQVMAIHIWAFVLYPMLTGRAFMETFVVQIFYVFKCIYFLFSAYQIRNGYPYLISTHYLTHGTSLYHRFAFKLYRMVPYLFEMRSLLDWTCTDTCLGVSDWFKMEEITQNIFDQKCQQDFEALMNDTGGKRKNRTVKYFVGGVLFGILFLTIIFPFLLFSLSGSVGVKTHPSKLNLEVYMGSAEPIFNSYASQKSLTKLSESDFRNLTRTFNNIHESERLFGAFQPEDVVVVRWSSHSLSSWSISPGSLKILIEEVKAPKPFTVRVVIRYTHVGGGEEKTEKMFGQSSFIPPLPDEARQILLDMLEKDTDSVVWLPLVFPKFMVITKEAKPKALPIMEEPSEDRYAAQVTEEIREEEKENDDDDDDEERNPKRLRNLLLSLQRNNGQLWWLIKEDCEQHDDNYLYYLKYLVHNSCDDLVMYIFNEKVFSGTMHYVTGGGIMGLYFIYFMMVFGVIRSCMIDVNEIWIEDLPSSDIIMRKCKELYLARDMQNYELEEELFSELIFIMRSREICIKLTRYQDDPYNPTFITPGTKRSRH